MTETRSSSQLEGVLIKLPMSKPDTDRWLRRTFVVRDGFLLYYDEAKVATSWFDTRPKFVLPLGHARISKVNIPSHPYCIRIESPELDRGRELILSCSSEREQTRWVDALERATVVSFDKAMQGAALVTHLEQEIIDNRKLAYDAQERAVLAETSVAHWQREHASSLEAKAIAERRLAELELSSANHADATADDARSRFTALQSEIASITAVNVSLQQTVTRLESELAAAREFAAVPKPVQGEETGPLKRQVEALQAEVSRLQNEVKRSFAESDMLREQLEMRQKAVGPVPEPLPELEHPVSTDALHTPSPDKPLSPSHGIEPAPSDAEALHNVSVKAARAIFESARKPASSTVKP